MEFGARRAHGVDAAVSGARAAIIGGAVGTSCTLSAKEFNVPASGTMAHSWIQSFDSEYEAFKTYAEIYPNDCTLLIDTYNTIESGLPNAIKVFDEILKPQGMSVDYASRLALLPVCCKRKVRPYGGNNHSGEKTCCLPRQIPG